MDDEDFEDSYAKAVKAGESNLRTKKLLENWCLHAEFVRTGGRGMIEEMTGLPIGHMGVQCKFSKKNSMYSWLLEDSVYDFYKNNCEGCEKRVHVGLPNIMEFVEPRAKAAEKRKAEREEQEIERKQRQEERRLDRERLRHELSLDESHVLSILDELDGEEVVQGDSRLEDLARLAPETFTRKVIEFLLSSVVYEGLPYSRAVAKALISVDLKPSEQHSIAVYLVRHYDDSQTVIDVILSTANQLSYDDLKVVLNRFASIALEPPPGLGLIGEEPRKLNSEPIKSLLRKRRKDICDELDVLLKGDNPSEIETAAKIIVATSDKQIINKYIRNIFAKLMRRRTILPNERRDSSVLYYLRKAASMCLEYFPEQSDTVIQSFLADNDKTGTKEANKAYSSVLKISFKEPEQEPVRNAQKIAFRRLLWAAVEGSGDSIDDARNFFAHTYNQYSQLAAEYFDDLIGAAATLTEKLEQLEIQSSIDRIDKELVRLEQENERSSIDALQDALINWAVLGAKTKGREGTLEFLDLYHKLPENQIQMRGKMIKRVSKLLAGVESLSLTLSDWYRGLMDEHTVIRARAAQAWEDVPYDLIENFPDLFFEAFAVLLSDPYVFVHKSAVYSIKRRAFPKDKQNLIKSGLFKLIVTYAGENKHDRFLVDCIDTFVSCLSNEERSGEFGAFFIAILLNMEDGALYNAINRLHYRFNDVPGFCKVALKSIQSGYTRAISIDDCVSVILNSSTSELKKCTDEVKRAFLALKPYRPENFSEALVYGAVLTKAGDYAAASECFREMVSNIPEEDRHQMWRLQASLVAKASEIENAITKGNELWELIKQARSILVDLEKENEERDKIRSFPPSFFLED